MKILWHSNAPAPLSSTGYGVQTGLFAPRIAKLGHEVAISCMTSVADHVGEWEGLTLYPGGMTAFSADILHAHARHFFGGGPGLVLTLYDAWAVTPEAVAGLAAAAWAPVHSDPMSDGDRRFFALSGAQPIAMSRYGERQMRAAGLSPAYVPHGVDTQVFRPLDDAERADYRARLHIPEGSFVIAVVAANKGTDPARKAWGEQFAAFAEFRARHPEAIMFVHSLANAGFGVDMRPILANLGIAGSVIFSDDYAQVAGLYPAEYVARVQGCADVVSNPSYGEGFGLAALQAQACGTPVIVGDNSAQTELCGSGWKVACQRYWHPGDQAWWHAPSITSITAAFEKAWRQAQRPDAVAAARLKARAFAEGYDADLVLDRDWKPALEMLEQYAGAARVRARRPGRAELPAIEADGLRWLSRGSHTDDWIAVGHEAGLAPALDELLPEGGVLLDVGAHVGRWALRLAAKASRVIAVESNPDTAAVLRYHIALNGIENTEVIEMAAWDEPARLTLSDPNKRITGGSTRVLEGDGGTVEALPLDAVLDGLDRLDLIKLDVEGADLHALRGMAGTLARLRPVLFIEDHSIYGYYELADLIALLESLGYAPHPFTAHLAADRTAPYVIAEPLPRDGDSA